MLQATVLGKQIYDITGRELDIGLLGLAEFLPAALLVLVTGSVADRFNRKSLVESRSLLNSCVQSHWRFMRYQNQLQCGHYLLLPLFLVVLAHLPRQRFGRYLRWWRLTVLCLERSRCIQQLGLQLQSLARQLQASYTQ